MKALNSTFMMYLGVIFCELVNEFVLQNSKPEFLRKINCNNPKKEQIIQNFEIALAEIRQNHQIIKPPFIFKLQPSTLAEVTILFAIYIIF